MSLLRVPVVFLVALAAATVACNRVETRAEPDLRPRATGPNVLLVTIDTLRADRVGAYGAATAAPTPALDALASEGSFFRKAQAPTPITLPSHASILTGQTPPRHGVRHNGLFRLSSETITLAERFQQAGYDTGAVVAAVVLDAAYGLDQGFDHYDAEISSRRAGLTGFHERRAEEVTEAALAWLGRREPGRPFLLWVHYYDPHAVYDPPPPFDERHRDDLYAGEIAYVDSQLSRLIEALRVGGALDETVVAVTADHGESLGEHGEATHSYTVYDAALHVPADPAWPRCALGHGRTRGLDHRPGADPGGPGRPRPAGRSRGHRRCLPSRARAAHRRWLVIGSRPFAGLLGDPGHPDRSRLGAAARAAQRGPPVRPRAASPSSTTRSPIPEQLHNLLESEPRAHDGEVSAYEERLSAILSAEGAGEKVVLDAATRAQLQALGYAIPAGEVVESGLDPKQGIRLIEPFERAKAEYQEGRIDEALRGALSVLKEFEASPGTHDLLARIYLSTGQAQRARRHAERALELAPSSPHQHNLLGLTQVPAKDYAGAIASFERALALDPQHANSRAGLMWRLRAGGTLPQAEADAEAAITLEPQSAEIRVLIGDLWDQLGYYERSLQRYSQAAALDPSNGHAHLGIAVQTARLGDVSEVEQHLARAGFAGRALGSRMRVAIALATRGENERAEAMLRGILAEVPDFRRGTTGACEAAGERGPQDEAEALRAASKARGAASYAVAVTTQTLEPSSTTPSRA